MKYGIVKHTTDFRGDHEAEVAIYFDTKDNETVEDLIKRTNLDAPRRSSSGDYLEIHCIATP